MTKAKNPKLQPKPEKPEKKFDKVIRGFEWFSFKIGQQRHLAALKDALMFIMPLIIVGALAVLFVTIIFGGWGSEKTSVLGWIWMAAHKSTNVVFTGSWKEVSDFGTNVFAAVKSAGIDTMSLFISFFIGYFIASGRKIAKPLHGAIISLVSFFIMMKFDYSFLSAKGVFPAIIVSLLAAEFFCWLTKIEKLKIKMPSSVPPMVATAFSVLIPIVIVLSAFATVQGLIILSAHLSHFNINETVTTLAGKDDIISYNKAHVGAELISGQALTHDQILELLKLKGVSVDDEFKTSISGEWTGPIIKLLNKKTTTTAENMNFVVLVYHFFTLPIIHFAGGNGGLGLAILHQFLCAFFFFFGIHGSNLTSGIFDPIWMQTHAENVAVLEAGGNPPYIFTQAFFWIFANIGGTGSTLSLIIVVLLFSKNKGHVEVSKFSLPAGIFQVNEPVTYGFPIVANPIFAVPYIINPILTVTTAWLFIGPIGMVSKPIVLMPWTMPNIIGAPLVTKDWKAIIITTIQIGITMLTYFPAVLIDNKVNGDPEAKMAFARMKDFIRNRK